MGQAGWVYVLINPSMPGLAKVGMTSRDPEGRAQELSGATGVPTPFLLAFEAYVSDCAAAEALIHEALAARGLRVAENREFFSAPLKEIVPVVSEVAQRFVATIGDDTDSADASHHGSVPHEPAWVGPLQEADEHYYGLGEELEDPVAAWPLYKNAARLGSGEACLRLGEMCALGEGTPQDEGAAMRWFREATRLPGGHAGWAELGRLYADQGHAENALKAWARFFQDALAYASVDVSERARYCWWYFRVMADLCKPYAYREQMLPDRHEIIAWSEESLAILGTDPANEKLCNRVRKGPLRAMRAFLRTEVEVEAAAARRRERARSRLRRRPTCRAPRDKAARRLRILRLTNAASAAATARLQQEMRAAELGRLAGESTRRAEAARQIEAARREEEDRRDEAVRREAAVAAARKGASSRRLTLSLVMAGVFVIAVLSAVVVTAVSSSSPPRQPPPTRRGSEAAGLAGAELAVQRGNIESPRCKLFEAEGYDAEALRRLKKGATVRILGHSSQGWRHVEIDGARGYLSPKCAVSP